MEFLSGARPLWRRSLAEVQDDMESLYLRAQRAQLDFTVAVPGKGARWGWGCRCCCWGC